MDLALIESKQAMTIYDTSLQHTFSDGMYARSCTLKKGNLFIGERHRNKCLNIISQGEMIVYSDGKVVHLKAPCVFESGSGVRKVAYIIEDIVWTNVHKTDLTNLDKLKEELIYNEPITDLKHITGVLNDKLIEYNKA